MMARAIWINGFPFHDYCVYTMKSSSYPWCISCIFRDNIAVICYNYSINSYKILLWCSVQILGVKVKSNWVPFKFTPMNAIKMRAKQIVSNDEHSLNALFAYSQWPFSIIYYIKSDRQLCFITLSAEEMYLVQSKIEWIIHLFWINYSKCKTTNNMYKVYKWNEMNSTPNTLYKTKSTCIEYKWFISLISIPNTICFVWFYAFIRYSLFVILFFYLFAVHQFNILHQRTVHLPDNYDDEKFYAWSLISLFKRRRNFVVIWNVAKCGNML